MSWDGTIDAVMNASVPPPIPTQKKGLSCLAMGGIGCLVLIVVAFLGGGALLSTFLPQIKQFVADAEKDPARAAAMLALKVNPDIEVQSTDEEKRTVTFKVKSSGETMTVSFEDISKGKLTMTNAKGEEISFDASKAAEQGIVMKGPDGQAVIGGSGSAAVAPAWVPAYPGGTVQEGGFKVDKADGAVTGMTLIKTSDPLAKVRAFYEASFKADGYEVSSTFSEENKAGNISANQASEKIRIGVTVSTESDGQTQAAITYQKEP
jgi:hypothetical protein